MNREEIDNKIKDFQNSFNKIAESNNFTPQEQKKLTDIFNKNLTEAEKVWKEALKPDASFFEKVLSQQQAANILQAVVKELKGELAKKPEIKSLIDKFSQDATKFIKENITTANPEIIQMLKNLQFLQKN